MAEVKGHECGAEGAVSLDPDSQIPRSTPTQLNVMLSLPSALLVLILCVRTFTCFTYRPSVRLGTRFTALRCTEGSALQQQPIPRDFIEYDHYGIKRHAIWDAKCGSFVSAGPSSIASESLQDKLRHLLTNSFLPTGDLSADYYKYSSWRAAQRLVSATNTVFGTQALLLALGLRRNHIGLAAATSWVIKDAAGKFSRIVWASKFGRRFDADAKKWRFRSALLFSAGNALEIATYLVPASFLLTAAMGTACKQMAMLTSSSTRNTIYRSFSRNSDNIGDITAKGEAQTAVLDVLGLGLGVGISKVMNASKRKIVMVFALLSALDLFCVYQEVRSVVFNTLNLDRCNVLLRDLLAGHCRTPQEVAAMEHLLLPSQPGEQMFTTWSQLRSPSAVLPAAAVALAEQRGDKYILLLDARPVRGLRALWTALGLSRDLLLIRAADGHSVSVTASLLLHKEAGPVDIFQAIVTLNKALHDLRGAPSGALDAEHLQSVLAAAHAYEQTHCEQLLQQMTAAGWDCSRFSFGTQKMRVRW